MDNFHRMENGSHISPMSPADLKFIFSHFQHQVTHKNRPVNGRFRQAAVRRLDGAMTEKNCSTLRLMNNSWPFQFVLIRIHALRNSAKRCRCFARVLEEPYRTYRGNNTLSLPTACNS